MKHLGLKIAVLNFSGNVGKTTLARHLLRPRLPQAAFISIETINADGQEELLVKGSDYARVQEEVLVKDAVIVDVGGSNTEQFFSGMRKYPGSHEDYDLFITPCVAGLKQQQDTLQCVKALAALGVPANKLWVIFNMVTSNKNWDIVFDPLLNFVRNEGLCRAEIMTSVQQSEVLSRLHGLPDTVASILNDPRDYKTELMRSNTAETRLALCEKFALQLIAKDTQENLDAVFAALVKRSGRPRNSNSKLHSKSWGTDAGIS